MKRKFPALGAAVLLFSAVGAAQTSGTKTSSTKAVVSGKVSPDGKTIIGDHNTWSVSNPDSLAGREGHLVKLKVRLYAATNEIRILAVRLLDSQTQYAANKGDSAFRR
jgi:hypothetical protein